MQRTESEKSSMVDWMHEYLSLKQRRCAFSRAKLKNILSGNKIEK